METNHKINMYVHAQMYSTYTCRYHDRVDVGSPGLYWGWTLSIGGPVVYLLAVAHAVMWTRISSILGSVVCAV